MEESSEESNDDDRKKQKKTKGNKIDTQEEIKALRDKLEGIAPGDRRQRTGAVWQRC